MARWVLRGPDLADEADLDDYMHEVAGRVGWLLTELFALDVPEVAAQRDPMMALGRDFGLALQTVNVIRGLHADWRRGWVYVPRSFAGGDGSAARVFSDEADPALEGRVLEELVAKAERHLAAAADYIARLPRRSRGIRLFCLLPHLFAVRTLALSRGNRAIFRRETKISRAEVRQIVAGRRDAGMVKRLDPLVRGAAERHRVGHARTPSQMTAADDHCSRPSRMTALSAESGQVPQELWSAVEQYLTSHILEDDPVLRTALEASDEAGLPAIQVSPVEGRFLNLVARLLHARSVLEIGTLGGYSAICMARALPPDGKLITLEKEPGYAEVARRNVERAGLATVVEIRVAAASEALARMVADSEGPFDLAFIDADKHSTPHYFDMALRLARPGSVIVVDNVVREGSLIQAEEDDADAQGMRSFLERVAREPRVDATVLQTVGSKGYDGFAFVLVTS